jgi:hypothetical protein
MPRQDLMDLVLRQFTAGETRTLEDVFGSVFEAAGNIPISESDVRSAILTLLRRNELRLTEDFRLRLADIAVAA